MWGYGWGSWLVMAVVMIVFWGLVIVAIVALVRYAGGAGRRAGQPRTAGGPAHPEEVLAQRFARGEINEDEYKRGLELLRTGR